MAIPRSVQASKFLYLLTTFFQLQFTIAKPVGFSLELVPIDSPQSLLYPGNLPQLERIRRFADFYKDRSNPIKIFMPLNRSNLWYSARINVGQPSTEVAFLVATSSGLTWAQCSPCKSCFPQRSSVRDLRNSKTYEQLSCKHPLCRKPFRCVKGRCVYNINYDAGGRRGKTSGVVSLDAIKLPLRDRTSKLFYRFVFGCSNDGQQFGLSGILGLNRSPVSFTNQVFNEVKGRFSYCLHAGNSYLRFGDDVPAAGWNFSRTPFINPKLPQYHLNLIDMSVGPMLLKLPKGSFSLKKGGCVIDMGVPYTVIARNAYRKVIRAFADYYTGRLERIDGSDYGLELCYRYKEGFRMYAAMSFHFQGADLVVNPTHVHVFNLQAARVCVAVVAGDQTVLGALQQWGTRFVYDLKSNVLRFAHENCKDDEG